MSKIEPTSVYRLLEACDFVLCPFVFVIVVIIL